MRCDSLPSPPPAGHTVGILVTGEMELLDLAGPQAVFKEAALARTGSYRVLTIGLAEGPVAAEGGVTLLPDTHIGETDLTVDTLLVPGGAGVRLNPLSSEQYDGIRLVANSAERLVSICTGAFLLARAGLLSGRRVATHWCYADALAAEFTDIDVDGSSIYLRDGRIWTSGGVTAGIDLALALVREDHGVALVSRIARQLNVYLHRPGDQAQYSEPLGLQFGSAGGFAALVEEVTQRPSQDVSIARLAARMNMSERNFSRRFTEATGLPPARYFERLRLDIARQLLSQGELGVERVARYVGFNSADSFTRAFERVFRVAPSFYRRHFDTSTSRD